MIKKSEFCILSSFIIRSIFFGGSMYAVLNLTNQDSWISIIIAYIIGFIPLIIYYLLLNHDPKLNIVSLTNKYLGKIGKIINLLISLFVLFYSSIVLWNLINFISTQYLYLTPLLAIAIVFMIGIFYLSSKGLKTIARTGTILYILNIVLFLAAFLSLIVKADLSNFLPFLNNNVFSGSLICITFNILPLYMLTIIPKDNIENNKKLIKNFIIIYTLTMLSILLVVISVISIFGPALSKLYQYPEYHILKTINVANFFQRVETILSVQWIFDSIMAIVFSIYFIKTSLVNNFNLKFNKVITFIICSLIVILSHFIFPNNTIAETFALKLFPYLLTIFFLVVPFIILIVVKLKKNKI